MSLLRIKLTLVILIGLVALTLVRSVINRWILHLISREIFHAHFRECLAFKTHP